MYELVKKKSTLKRILIGILGLFVLTQILKFFLKEPTIRINDELVKAANEINKHAPVIIDSVITFTSVNALNGNVFEYNYTLKVIKESVDTFELKKNAKEDLIKNLKQNPNANYFKENNVIIQSKYSDSTGNEICKISILPFEY